VRRPRAAVAVIVGALVVAGCSDDSTPATPTSESTASEEQAIGAAHVRRIFARHGLPLREASVRSTEVRGVRLYRSEPAGPVFQVEVYPTVDRAIESVNLTLILLPADYAVRGSVSKEREASVVVVFESGRPGIRERFRAAIADLR
jgi:Mg-chelatase subunit ChlD